MGLGDVRGVPARQRSGCLLGSLLNQALNRRRGLGTDTLPVGQAVQRDPDALFAGGRDRVVKADALDEPAIAARALVSNDDVEKWAGLGITTGKSNDDPDLSFGGGGNFLPPLFQR